MTSKTPQLSEPAAPHREAPVSRRSKVILGAALGVVAAYGLGLRLWMTGQPLGSLDGDMAILGLMAIKAQAGDLAVFHWGQVYGGAQETYIAALLGAFSGVTTFTLQITTILLAAVTTGFLWLATREVAGRRVATVAASLFWVWPGPFVWWSVKIGSNYWFAAAAALAFVWLLLRERHREPSVKSTVLIGGVLGLAWWANPQTLYIILPVLLTQARMLWERRRMVTYFAAAFAAGAGPWVYINARYGGASLLPPNTPLEDDGPFQGLQNMFTHYWPMIAGTRVPFSGEWLVAPWLPLLILFLVAAGGVAIARSKNRPLLPIVGMATFVVVFPLTPFAHYVEQPRYAFWATPWLVMLVAAAVCSSRLPRPGAAAAALVVAAATLTTVQLNAMNQGTYALYDAPDVPAPASSDDVVALLDQQGATRAYGDYWLAFRVTFETRERIIVAPHYSDRYRPYSAAVRRSATPPHIFLRDSRTYPLFLQFCKDRGLECTTHERGAYALVETSRHVASEEFLPVLIEAGIFDSDGKRP